MKFGDTPWSSMQAGTAPFASFDTQAKQLVNTRLFTMLAAL